MKATLVTSSNTPDEVVYLLVKSVFERIDTFRNLHPAFANIEANAMLQGNSAPFHPGALRYFREVGLMK